VRKHYEEVKFSEELASVVNRLLNAGRKSILVFTRFTDEAEHLARVLGKRAAVVTGDTPANERESVLRRFKAGSIDVVTNVGVLTTGFDFAELDTVVLARPTMSLALYYQMVGRAIRPCKGKTGWVVDLCGNYKRFGRVDNLELRQRKPGIWAVYSGQKQLTNVWFGK
jgi:DNA repair protein RadD